MRNNIICWITCILTCFASSNFSQDINPDSIKIYLVKEGWHTGLMIPVNDFTKQTLPVINYFDGFEYVDIGWGDEDFYQTPGFDLYLAAKAILIPTPSVIRIDGYKFKIEKVIEWREFAIMFTLSIDQYLKLCEFINRSFQYSKKNEIIISLKDDKKPIIFFKSVHSYCYIKTCNTWAADALHSAGYNFDTFGLVTSSQLYSKLKKFGEVLKSLE